MRQDFLSCPRVLERLALDREVWYPSLGSRPDIRGVVGSLCKPYALAELDPKLVSVSGSGAKSLGLEGEACSESEGFASLGWVLDKEEGEASSLDDLFIDLDGKKAAEDTSKKSRAAAGRRRRQWSFAACYGGHQFGVFAGQLGDGRCVTVGECRGYEVNLKGSGQTQYSRNGDGLVTFRSAAREFLAAEALYGLGIPTSRSLALWSSDLYAWRPAPDGSTGAKPERMALLARFGTMLSLRFGTLELAAARGDAVLLNQLIDFALDILSPANDTGSIVKKKNFQEKRAELGLIVADRTANLAAYWDVFGFVHGVANTDNFCLSGETLDFGPFAFVEIEYDLAPNLSDRAGRYRRSRQAQAVRAAVAHLGDALNQHDCADIFDTLFQARRDELWCARLALPLTPENARLAQALASAILSAPHLDFSITLRTLVLHRTVPLPVSQSLLSEYIDRRYKFEREHCTTARQALEIALNAFNPVFVLRNSIMHDAIDSYLSTDDPTDLDLLLQAASRPFDSDWLHDNLPPSFLEPANEGRIPGRSLLSCSS